MKTKSGEAHRRTKSLSIIERLERLEDEMYPIYNLIMNNQEVINHICDGVDKMREDTIIQLKDEIKKLEKKLKKRK